MFSVDHAITVIADWRTTLAILTSADLQKHVLARRKVCLVQTATVIATCNHHKTARFGPAAAFSFVGNAFLISGFETFIKMTYSIIIQYNATIRAASA